MSRQSIIQDLVQKSWSLRYYGDYEGAGNLLKEAHKLCPDDDHHLLGRIFHIYAQFESDQSKYEEALKMRQKSVQHYRKTGNSDKIAHSVHHVADVERELSLNDNSLEHYREAIKLYRANDDTFPGDLANALRGYALVLGQVGEKEQAVSTWKEVKSLYSALNLQEGVDEAQKHLRMLS